MQRDEGISITFYQTFRNNTRFWLTAYPIMCDNIKVSLASNLCEFRMQQEKCMRVITGIAKGKRLKTLEGLEVRPTTDRVKEAIFSIIQFDIEGRRVLDLFSGSGQLGIEALSRGAESATFVDRSSASIKVIKENLANVKLEEKANVLQKDAVSYLAMCRERFDIAFLDPPYHHGLFQDVLPLLSRMMSKGGIILCEAASSEELPVEAGPFHRVRIYQYGKSAVTLYRHKDVT